MNRVAFAALSAALVLSHGCGFAVATSRSTLATEPSPTDEDVDGLAREAIAVALNASRIARNLDERAARALQAQASAFDGPLPADAVAEVREAAGLAKPVAHDGNRATPRVGGTAGGFTDMTAAQAVAAAVSHAVQEAVDRGLREVVPAATNLAIGYVRKDLLAVVGPPAPALAIPPPVALTTPVPLAISPVVDFTVVIANVDYAQLMAKPVVVSSFTDAARKAVVDHTGGIFKTSDVSIVLRAGLVVTFSITAPGSVTASEVKGAIAPVVGKIASDLVACLPKLPGIGPAITGPGPSVSSIVDPDINDPNQPRAPAPAPAFAPAPANLPAPAPAVAVPQGPTAIADIGRQLLGDLQRQLGGGSLLQDAGTERGRGAPHAQRNWGANWPTFGQQGGPSFLQRRSDLASRA